MFPCPSSISPEEVAAYPYTSLDREIIASRQSSNIIGSPETVRRGLTELLAATDADELMITTMVFDPADRLRSLQLVAEIAAQARGEEPECVTSSAGPAAQTPRGMICRAR